MAESRMMTVEQLNTMCPTIQCTNTIELLRYYNMSENLYKYGVVNSEQGDLDNAYLSFRKFVNMVVHAIPKHNQYNSKMVRWKPSQKEERRERR